MKFVLVSCMLCRSASLSLTSSSGSVASSRSAHPASSDSSLGALPLEWFHVPKTGTSFANALVHTPGWCPGFPKDFVFSKEYCKERMGHAWYSHDIMRCPQAMGIDPVAACNRSIYKFNGVHRSMGDIPATVKGAVAFFRQPEQRMLSHYEFFVKGHGGQLKNVIPEIEGCTVKMMVRTGDGLRVCSRKPPPTSDETAEAIKKIGMFAFVGIAEEWDLSICLFRKMFGGECVGSDFVNNRPTAASWRSSELDEDPDLLRSYPTDVLYNYTDKHDGALYAAVRQKFQRLLNMHGVNAASCARCYASKDRAFTPAEL